MTKTSVACALFGAAILAGAGYSVAQPAMPSDDVMNKAMQAAKKRAGSVLDDAASQAMPGNVTMPRMVPEFANKGTLDPAALAESYKKLGKPDDAEAPELMVFVSLSMPEESLRRIGMQAKKLGAVVVLRGMKFGLRNWNDSVNALKPISNTGADIQIHPELFTRYNVTAVPTLVVSSSPKSGCQDEACASQAASVTGDVSLDYALERLTDRKDTVGAIARERVKRLKNG